MLKSHKIRGYMLLLVNILGFNDNILIFLDLAVAKSLQSTRTVTDDDADADDADV